MRFHRMKSRPPRPADFRCKAAPQYPYNREPQSPELSRPEYGVKIERNVYVPVSDGARIAVDIYHPDKEGAYPAIFSMSNYTKELQGSDSASLCNEAGDIEYFVSRGYVFVIADSRGSGHSEGAFSLFNDREAKDGAEVIEWIAGRPWCTGGVGMSGMSYFATVQLLVAKKNPPHLKCIFAYDPIYDLYRDCCYHGGKLSLFGILFPYFVATAQLMYLRGEPGARRKVDWRSFFSMLREFAFQKHRFDDDWMHCRSGYWSEGELRVPVYVGSGWEYAVGLHLRGIFDVFRDARGAKKMLVGPPWVPYRPYSSWRLEALRWYDRWLKGMETGIERDPPVNLWIMGKNVWRSEHEWPPARTRYVDLYLKPLPGMKKTGMLDLSTPQKDAPAMSYCSWPFSAGNLGFAQLVWRTPVLRSEVEVTGHIVLILYASMTAKDTGFCIRLCDESDDGTFRVVTRGWLKASHREVDEERSFPYCPFHPHQKEEKIRRNRIYEYRIEVWPTANVFLAGHRIRLELLCAESLYHDFPYTHFPSPHIGRVRIWCTPEYPSKLILPLIDTHLKIDNEGANLRFQDEPTSYFVMRGKERIFGADKSGV